MFDDHAVLRVLALRVLFHLCSTLLQVRINVSLFTVKYLLANNITTSFQQIYVCSFCCRMFGDKLWWRNIMQTVNSVNDKHLFGFLETKYARKHLLLYKNLELAFLRLTIGTWTSKPLTKTSTKRCITIRSPHIVWNLTKHGYLKQTVPCNVSIIQCPVAYYMM